MRRFLSLLHKELRDARALSIVCALLVPAAVVAMNVTYLHWRGDVTQWFAPTVIALYVAVIAADLVAGDVSSGRARAYAALPVSPATLWSAKLAFLALASTAFTAWTLAVTLGLYTAFAPPEAAALAIAEVANVDGMLIACAAGMIAVVVFWSGVLERGLAAIGAAIVTGAALGGILPLIHWYDRELLPSPDAVQTTIVVLLFVFLAASLHTFARSPHHASSVLRRLVVAMVVPVVVLLPAGTVSAAVLLQRKDVTLGAPGVYVGAGQMSPDGRYLVLLAQKRHQGAQLRTFMLDTEDGSVALLPQTDLQPDWRDAWDDDGNYVAWSDDDATKGIETRRVYDPETGAILETRSLEQINAVTRWRAVPGCTLGRDGDALVVRLDDSGIERRIEGLGRRQLPTFGPIPGYLLQKTPDGLILHDLVRDVATPIGPRSPSAWGMFSPGGEYVQVYGGDVRQAIFATRSGERIDTPSDRHLGWTSANSDDHFVVASRQDAAPALVDLRTGASYPIAQDPDPAAAGWFDIRVVSDRVLRVSPVGHVTSIALDGSDKRTLLDPRR